MKIRSITCFYDPGQSQSTQALKNIADFSQTLEINLNKTGFEVQSKRVATPPFTGYTSGMELSQLLSLMNNLEKLAFDNGFSYISFGPALPDDPNSNSLIPTLLAHTQNSFFGAIIADSHQVYTGAVSRAAEIISRASTITPDGFTNLRFAALANVPAGAPFLPAAYHQAGKPPAFALAIECADLVLDSFTGQNSLSAARTLMLSRLENAAEKIQKIIEKTNKSFNIEFNGFDFSPAPYPENWCSLGGAIEALGQNTVGPAGSLAAAAVIADTLDQGNWKRSGFNGLMLPVLEDSVLADRAACGQLTIKDLLLYSAVCGTGLDTIPLAGDTPKEEIVALLMDVAALSVRLGKPLTARLMPLPEKFVGDRTEFEFDYFANSRVMHLSSQPIHLPLNGLESIPLAPRTSYKR